jgi:predicted nuclease of predicted toxin-antitoxin system
MQFLADESCDFAVVRALRGAGYDVTAVAETTSSSEDAEVMRQARDEGRILITEDKDFGQLVFAAGAPSPGVILIRFPSKNRTALARTVLAAIREKGNAFGGRFVVVQPGRVRVSSSVV